MQNIFQGYYLLVSAGGDAPQSSGIPTMLLTMLPIFALMYFLMIRPQQKQRKVREEMIKSIKKGDRVVTLGGIYGIIRAIKDERITLEIASEVYVQFTKASIASVLRPGEGKSSKAPEPETIMDETGDDDSIDDMDDAEYIDEQDQDSDDE